jgi:YgiT-type zinc finger domain-containing protein
VKCVICKQGSTKPGVTSATLEREGMILVIKNVPAEICSNCGEPYIESDVSSQILKLANAALRSGVQVEICSFKAA